MLLVKTYYLIEIFLKTNSQILLICPCYVLLEEKVNPENIMFEFYDVRGE